MRKTERGWRVSEKLLESGKHRLFSIFSMAFREGGRGEMSFSLRRSSDRRSLAFPFLPIHLEKIY